MKTLAVILLAVATMETSMAQSSPRAFTPSASRQDLTGQGSFHRIGLIREQNRAITASQTRTQNSTPPRPSLFERLWQALFPRRTPPKPATAP